MTANHTINVLQGGK